MEATSKEIDVRLWRPDDEPQVLELLQSSLGWLPDDDHAAFFRWKHRENPFGISPGWVATAADGRVVGFRSFLRWRFRSEEREVEAVRAVDTVTSPTHQRRGIFRRLTLHGLDALASEGVRFVFNTPNSSSRPGYLKMGWTVVGRVPVAVRPTSLRSLPRLLRARVPAKRWGVATTAGVPARQVLEQTAALDELVASQLPGPGLSTARSASYLAWRYGFEPLGYRAMLAGDTVGDGVAFFRIRQRGPALEAVVAEVLTPGGDGRAARRLLGRIARQSRGDYALVVGGPVLVAAGYVTLPRTGPVLTWRPLTPQARSDRPSISATSMGDVELF